MIFLLILEQIYLLKKYLIRSISVFWIYKVDFVFRDTCKYFHQCFGCSMGSSISVISANLVMEDIERRIFLNSDFGVRHWRRFVDYVWALMPSDKVDDFLCFINSIEDNIQFTCEKEHNRDLPFLDILISRLDNMKFKNRVNRKPTHTNKYLDFNSIIHFTIHHRTILW